MARRHLDIAAEVARLAELTTFELRAEWRRLFRQSPPMRLSRDLLIRSIAYKLQERALGGLAGSMRKALAKPSIDPGGTTRKVKPPLAIKPGTRLVREWHGVTHTVLVHSDGIEWQGQRYRSLSIVACAITGAHWSGPRFFGLRQAVGAADG